ncbi:hypothetical protein DFH09DRAFT_1326541 [Mycena vulgaris]|nr:hypothetical protein DFH09DRAFT_1326541 [Mycena vulgaris]
MCDSAYTPLQSGVLFWALSLVPINIFRYVGLGAAAVSGMIYAAHYHHPSTRLGRLNNMVATTTEIIIRARSECLRDHVTLVEEEHRLLRAKLCASKIQSRLLEARDAPWKLYFQTIRAIWLSLDKCECKVRGIRTSTLAEHQRKLAEHINESREIVNAVGLREIDDTPPSLILRSPYLSSASRADISILSQLRTNFSALNAHRFRCRLAPSPVCDACGAAKETRAHYLLHCPAWEHLRPPLEYTSYSAGILGAVDVRTLLSHPKLLKPVVNLILRTRRFS